jgi:uridine phosphorylase
METSAIYGLTKLLGHRGMSVNAIVANRVNKTYSHKPQETVDRMIKNTLEVIMEKDL